MTFISKQAHSKPYRIRRNEAAEILELIKLTDEIRKCEIPVSLKKKFLKIVIWEMTRINGNFNGRYRSSGVLSKMGVKIQRDHVMRKEGLIYRLLNSDELTADVLKGTVHCVVTEEEHKCLTLFDKQNKSIDGWKRYEACKIEVYDFAGDKKKII